MTKLSDLEAKLAANQADLEAARAALSEAETKADAALLEGGPDALMAAQTDLQALSNRVSVLNRYAELLADQIPAARIADAKPQMEEKVTEARAAVVVEEAAYHKAIAAVESAVEAMEELNRRCANTSALLTSIRNIAASANIEPGFCGAVMRDGAQAMQMEIERVICTQLQSAHHMVAVVRNSARVPGIHAKVTATQ